jgi:hypothetical protein
VILQLEKKYGWVITYEEPGLQFAGDMEDISSIVRKDHQSGAIDPTKRLLAPKQRQLVVKYSSTSSIDAEAVAKQLVAADSQQNEGNSFRLEQTRTSRLHIVPATVKDSAGELQTVKPILNSTISVAAAERNGGEMLEAICDAVTSATGVTVMVGMVPNNPFLHFRTKAGYENLSARDALESLLDSMPDGDRYSWRLLYGDLPGGLGYMLNIKWIPKTTASPASPVEKPPSNTHQLKNTRGRVLTAPNSSPSSASAPNDAEPKKPE